MPVGTLEARSVAATDIAAGARRNAGLDALRGVACLLVMGFHFFGAQQAMFPNGDILARAASLGWSGIDLFFVLSGYLV
jgi:peptidoglycan/LPS O-acetylase OafA/YrhL